jgi:hypothetical protein
MDFLALINSMDQSPPWEADSHPAGPEISCFWWNLKVHYLIHKRPPHDLIMNEVNADYTLMLYFLRCVLIWSCHLCLGLPSDLSPSIFLKFQNLICIVNLIVQFSPSCCYFLPLRLRHFSLPCVQYQILHLHKTWSKIIVLFILFCMFHDKC